MGILRDPGFRFRQNEIRDVIVKLIPSLLLSRGHSFPLWIFEVHRIGPHSSSSNPRGGNVIEQRLKCSCAESTMISPR